jgi:hypothetical protein
MEYVLKQMLFVYYVYLIAFKKELWCTNIFNIFQMLLLLLLLFFFYGIIIKSINTSKYTFNLNPLLNHDLFIYTSNQFETALMEFQQ